MNIKKGDLVVLKRDIKRTSHIDTTGIPVLYAAKGEEGLVEEVFKVTDCGHPPGVVWHAKVRIAENLKTFRLTSLQKIQSP